MAWKVFQFYTTLRTRHGGLHQAAPHTDVAQRDGHCVMCCLHQVVHRDLRGDAAYFLGAQGFDGAQGLSDPFFFFFLAGPQGLSGPQGLAAFLLSLGADTGASAAVAALAGATSAVAIISAANVSVTLRRVRVCFFIGFS